MSEAHQEKAWSHMGTAPTPLTLHPAPCTLHPAPCSSRTWPWLGRLFILHNWIHSLSSSSISPSLKALAPSGVGGAHLQAVVLEDRGAPAPCLLGSRTARTTPYRQLGALSSSGHVCSITPVYFSGPTQSRERLKPSLVALGFSDTREISNILCYFP